MKRSTVVLAAVAVAAIAAAVYLPALWGELVYDDEPSIAEDYLHTPANLLDVLTFRVLGRDLLDANRPLMILSLMIDSMLWGREPFGYHLTNLVLHATCAALAFHVLLRVFRRMPQTGRGRLGAFAGALFGSALFAVHPVNSEAVCPVSFREDLLVALFTLLALALAERFPARRARVTALVGAACVLAMLAAVASKESGAAAPAILVAYWFIFRRGEQARDRRAWAALFAAGFLVAAAFLAARFALRPADSVIFTSKPQYPGGSFGAMLLIQPRIWAYQLRLILWPDRLCADNTHHVLRNWNLRVSVLVLAAACAGAVWLGRRNAGVRFGAIFYVLAILPVSNFVPIYCPMADRFLYLPMVGFCIAAGALACRMKLPAARGARVALAAGAVLLCAGLAAVALQRAFVWRTSRSLWEETAAKNPQSYAAHNNLGFALFDAGEFEMAEASFRRAIELAPNKPDARAGLAITLDARGSPLLAESELRQAAALDANYARPRNLARALVWRPDHAQKLQVIADRIAAQRDFR